jgi:hypothetical protein
MNGRSAGWNKGAGFDGSCLGSRFRGSTEANILPVAIAQTVTEPMKARMTMTGTTKLWRSRGLLGIVALCLACGRTTLPEGVARGAELVQAPMVPVHVGFAGEGSLEAQGEKTGKTRLALERLEIAAKTAGDVAESEVTHVFRNDADERLEGTFRFPLPEGAMITGLAMEIDGRMMSGELVERDKARKAYEEVVDKMLDPALLEWENGQTFKLRVFPIEPKRTKRVVLRFVAPLHRDAAGNAFFAYRPPSNEAGLTAEKVRLTVDGAADVGARTAKAPSGELLVKVDGGAPDVVSETTKEGLYLHARIAGPRTAAAAAPRAPIDSAQALIVLCDRSRSMLEARVLEAQTTALLVGALGPKDKFTVTTGDVTTRTFPGGLHAALAASESAAAAAKFVDGLEPDGASDLGKLLASAKPAVDQARAEGLRPVVVYLGDANPTWGETKTSEIERVTGAAIGDAALHVVLLGKSTETANARALAGAAHGRVFRPKTELDAKSAAALVVHAAETARLDDVHLVGADGIDVPLDLPSTIYEGDDVGLAAFVPAGKPLPTLTLTGTIDGKAFSRALDVGGAKSAGHVAQRWAQAKIERLEQDGDTKKDEVVKTSLDHGVMSRYTSFLVLESEEAYAKMNIERRAKQREAEEARVTGRDLESADGQGASVSPNHLQPGDPEVRIPAPADAQSVVVMFPFGETKTATFEPDEHGGSWVVRFLVDRHTPDGTYDITVRITHKDGRVEILTLPYVVDTARPHIAVTIVKKAGGAYEIHGKQELSPEEIAAQAPFFPGTMAPEERATRMAHVLTDAKRVEVRAPDGQVIALTHMRLGEFVGRWTPNAPVTPHSRLHVVTVDRALNEGETDVEIP